MAELTVTVGGQNHRLACEDGEEAHLARMAELVDAAASALPPSIMRASSEGRVMLMAALTVADRLAEAESRAARLERKLTEAKAELAEAKQGPGLFIGPEDGVTAERLQNIAERIEHIAERLSGE